MRDYWTSCGYRLLARGADGRLTLTDDFLRASLLRPELAPVPESCAAELALHDRLVAAPRAAVSAAELAALADADARDNYAIWLRFRSRLAAAPSIEAAYAGLFHEGVDVPPLFVQQLTQILLRHILGDAPPPLQARAAEMLFRPQKIAVTEDGAVMAADEHAVELYATTGGFGSLGELLQQNRTPLRTVDLDVLDGDNAESYWDRDERHDLAVSLNRGRPALDAMCRVLERWVDHFTGAAVTIRPQREIDDRRWVWHVGLDAEASALLNDLYNRVDVDDDRMGRLLCLFELEFANPADMRPAIAGRPVYLAMAMDRDQRLKLKPQNLLLNLPLSRPQ
ncbi:MAG: hypothetical protein IPG28_01635 [Betaproteobacteria bacterium]|nr:hypothetical protein [Betaproteobacteria bacterium]MBK7590960.1 hypothetical protein [Betaproteobacteria bacterium]